ncbi:MAG: sulfotransferase family protein, partial [Pseudomonadota bacterium]
MPKITALWAVPRSTSTAFEWMMRQRGDMACFHEPFGEAWYQGEDPLWPRLGPDSLRTPGLTLDGVRKMLEAEAAKGPVFSKDFPHYIEHMWDDALYDLFDHSFLIRDPAKTITSMYDKWPDFHEAEV